MAQDGGAELKRRRPQRRRRQRRRRLGVGVVLALVLLWVGGYGLRLWSRPGADRDALPSPRPLVGRGDASAAPAPAVAESLAAPVSAPVTHLQDQDRFFGRMAAVRTDAHKRRLSAAYAAFDLVRADALAPQAQGQVALLEQELEDALRSACDELQRLIEDGDAPRAATLVRDLLQPPHVRLQQALLALARAKGWPRLDGGDLPVRSAHAPLGDVVVGRHVRLAFHERWSDGTVSGVDAGGTMLTVRVEERDGVYHPAVPRASVALWLPSADELRSQFCAALDLGDSGLARAWLACCVARDVRIDAPLATALASWFRFD